MLVKILRACIAAGRATSIGEIVDIPEKDAKFLVAIKKAEKYEPQEKIEKEDKKDTQKTFKGGEKR